MSLEPFVPSSPADQSRSTSVECLSAESAPFNVDGFDRSPAFAIFAGTAWPERAQLRARFRCDRRESPRWVVPGHATILALGGGLGNVIELSRLDGAPWWLAGDATEQIASGTRVSVGFSEPDGRPATGIVERCEGFGQGRFRIAIRFDGAPVA
jgi:hypothetical protein